MLKQSLFSKQFIGFFIGCHILFIVAQIYNYTQLISYSYSKQKNEKLLYELKGEYQELTQQLYAIQDLKTVQLNAKKELGMKKIMLSQIKQLTVHDSTT